MKIRPKIFNVCKNTLLMQKKTDLKKFKVTTKQIVGPNILSCKIRSQKLLTFRIVLRLMFKMCRKKVTVRYFSVYKNSIYHDSFGG